MTLTIFLKELGRIVAYHPNLKKVTNSTTATLLLSQFLYWSDKTKDGWIYKTHYEIEEETGLTYSEQKTARKVLVDLNILQEKFKRWDRTNCYKINQKELNKQWEIANGREVKDEIKDKEPEIYEQLSLEDMESTKEEIIPPEQSINLVDLQDPKLHPEHPSHRSDAVKKGDLVDAIAFYSQSPGAKRDAIKLEIQHKIESGFHINIDNSTRWERFVDFVYTRQTKYNEPVEKFIAWAKKEKFNPIYWTPEKCRTVYPQAFAIEEEQKELLDNFIEPLPEQKEENYAPMPEDMKTKRKLV